MALSVPSAWKNAYAANAATISGSTHAATTTVEAIDRTGLTAERSSPASTMPSTFCPTTAERNTNTTVSQSDFGNSGSPNSAM